MTTHTPTPWSLYEDETNHWFERADKTAFTAGLHGVMSNEDAAFIVRAVNVHEELLTAAKRVRSVLNDEGKEILTKREMEDILFQAIAKAEGK